MTPPGPPAELEAALAAARERRDRAAAAFGHDRGDFEEYGAAAGAMLDAERALAAARGEAHGVPIDFPVRWSTGAPLPHLVRSDGRTVLLFVVEEVDPDWDGTYVNIVGPASRRTVAIVTFDQCASAKMGMPNDEAFGGHPLFGRGLAVYGAFRVVNSGWVAELAAINAVHPRDRPDHWASLTHFILGFHDSTFECVAKSFHVETREKTSMAEALLEVCRRVST